MARTYRMGDIVFPVKGFIVRSIGNQQENHLI